MTDQTVVTTIVKETQARTIVKAIIYRFFSVVAIMLLSLLFGASMSSAGIVGLIVIVVGTAIYYAHDRLWLLTNWARNDQGIDDVKRSIIKTIIYRAITMVVSYLIAIFVIKSNSSNAVLFAIAQALTNMTFFFIVERVFNFISWGKVVPESDV
jgi:uncharacterized membrane protein